MEDRKHRLKKRSDDGAIPLGARVAVVFLDLIIVLLVLPMIFAAASCLASLAYVVQDQGLHFQWVMTSASIFLIFEAFFGVSLAGFWMVCLLRSRYPLTYPGQLSPGPPLLAIVRPMAVAAVLQSTLAIVMWFGARAFGRLPSWLWLYFWMATGAAAWFLKRWINRSGQDASAAS